MNYTIVDQEDRENFIPTLVNMDMAMLLNFENRIYHLMDQLNPEYKGGMWDFIEMENGAKAMVLISDEVIDVPPQPNFFEDSMEEFYLTYAINIMVYSSLSFSGDKSTESMGENYHLLREALPDNGNPEISKIFQLLD